MLISDDAFRTVARTSSSVATVLRATEPAPPPPVPTSEAIPAPPAVPGSGLPPTPPGGGGRLAAAPDLADKHDPWGAIDGTRGGLLWGVCAASGEKIAELKLPAPPVFDGMSSAGGMLFASLKDGRIICCRSKKSVTY